MIVIKIYETVTQEPNGDRDISRHPCSKFEVLLFNEELNISHIVKIFDQFDSSWTGIRGTRDGLHKEARSYAESLGLVLNGMKIQDADETKNEKEIMDAQAEIRRLEEKIKDLKKAGL